MILAEPFLPPQYTPHSKHYATKTVWFRGGIIKRGIKLFKIGIVVNSSGIYLPKQACPKLLLSIRERSLWVGVILPNQLHGMLIGLRVSIELAHGHGTKG